MVTKRKSSVITPKQEKFVEGVLSGKTTTRAAKEAGFNTNKRGFTRTKEVQEALADARAGISQASTLTRMDVIEGVLEAIQLARLTAEPAVMIQGYDKLAKIMGYYAPEVKKVEMTMTQERHINKMEGLSDTELMALADGRAVLDGEFTVVHEKTH